MDFVGCRLTTMEFIDENVRSPMKECKVNDFGSHEGRKRMKIGFYAWPKNRTSNETFKNWLSGLYGGFDGHQWLCVGRMAI